MHRDAIFFTGVDLTVDRGTHSGLVEISSGNLKTLHHLLQLLQRKSRAAEYCFFDQSRKYYLVFFLEKNEF